MMRSDAYPLALMIAAVETPLGGLLLVSGPDGQLHASEFADRPERLHRLLDRRIGKDRYALLDGNVPDASRLSLEAYFKGDLAAINDIPVAFTGTNFQRQMWTALRTVPPGAPITYADMATAVGQPGSARAVGHANAANPFEIVVPCHRLVGKSGSLTGYGGGLERKRWLLDHERRHASTFV